MKDPYDLIRELIFKCKGKSKKEATRIVLDAFKEAYGLYLPDLMIPYEELVHYVVEGREDEAYDFLEKYLYDYLLRRYEEELRAEEEKAREIGEAILKALREKKIKVLQPEKAEEYVLKILKDYPSLLDKVKKLQRELSRLKKKEAEVNLKYEKGEATLEDYLRIAREVERKVKPLEEEIIRLRREKETLLRKLRELERRVPEARKLKKEIEEDKYVEKLEEEAREFEREVKKEVLERELWRKIITTPTDVLETYARRPEVYLPEFVEVLGKERVLELINKELKKRVTVPAVPKVKVKKLPKVRLPRELYLARIVMEAYAQAPDRYKPIIELCVTLGVKHPKKSQYFDVESLKYELRASAIFLYRINKKRYESIKNMFRGLIPEDLFNFIFPY